MKWIRNNFPEVSIIFIIRHPCGVISSKKKRDWYANLELIIKQESLINDYIKPYLDEMSSAKNKIQKNACQWCVRNLIPFRMMEKNDWYITTYEDLVYNFEAEMKKILKYLFPRRDFEDKKFKNIISKQVNEYSAIVTKKDLLKIWRERLNQNEIDEVLRIVKKFSLDSIYDKNILPKKNRY